MQRPKPRSDQVVARLAPYRIASGVRTDRSRGNGPLSRRCALDDRLEQTRWCARAHQLVNVAKVQAELVVPDRVHAGVMFPAEPPEPVAALGDQDLAPRQRGLLGVPRTLLGLRVEPFAGLGKQVPRNVVLRVSDPRVEARADPAAGMKVMQQLLGRMLGEKVGD